jgi:hypothetical protein
MLIESVDYAVLVVAIHSASQIFRPAGSGNSDGLYEYRTYIFLGALVLPTLMAALAFVNAGPAFEFLGALCQLPIRPFWYRLALAWIPRYLMGSIILVLAGAIYAYVGCESRSYANLSQNSMNPMTSTLGSSVVNADFDTRIQGIRKARSSSLPDSLHRVSSVAHDVVSHHRRRSGVALKTTAYAPLTPSTENNPFMKTSTESSTFTPLTPLASVHPSLFVIPSRSAVRDPPSAHFFESPISPLKRPMENPITTIASGTPVKDEISQRDCSPPSPAQRHLAHQRQRIQHQLRPMFIYSNHYANHPIFFIRIGQIVCLTSMGFVNSPIFCLREKPRRSISTSDDTLWGGMAV